MGGVVSGLTNGLGNVVKDVVQVPVDIYNGITGNNVFNTDNNYLSVIDVWGATFSGSSRPTVTRSGYPSGTYAVVLGWPRLLFTSFTTPITYQTDGINCTSTSVAVASNVSGTGGNSFGWSDHTGYQYSGTSINMTINVTGY